MSQYKRVEIYVGHSCNHKCGFCIEWTNNERGWNIRYSEKEMLKKLISYRKQGYNHVTFLGGEPFIQKVFPFSLQVAKKLGFTILVTTNASMLQYEHIAKKLLPYIDQLLISIPIIDKTLQPIINGTKNIIDFDKVFYYIHKYWSGNFLKVNTVLNKKNYQKLLPIVQFVERYKVEEISFTFPEWKYEKHSDWDATSGQDWRYDKNSFFNLDRYKDEIADFYTEYFSYLRSVLDYCNQKNIRAKVVDFPFCVLKDEKYIRMTDDYCYAHRIKQSLEGDIEDRNKRLPRARKHIDVCKNCTYKSKCWGISYVYESVFGSSEIVPISS